MLNEFIIADAALKLFTGEKIVVNAVLFADAGIAGGAGDGKFEAGHGGADTTDEGGFTDAAGAGENDHSTIFAHKKSPKK